MRSLTPVLQWSFDDPFQSAARTRNSLPRRLVPLHSRAPLKLLLPAPALCVLPPPPLSLRSPNTRRALYMGPRPSRLRGLCHLRALVAPDNRAREVGSVHSCKLHKPLRSARSLVLELPRV